MDFSLSAIKCPLRDEFGVVNLPCYYSKMYTAVLDWKA